MIQRYFVFASRIPVSGSALSFTSENFTSYFQPSNNGGALAGDDLLRQGVSNRSAAKPLALVVDDVADVTDMLSVFLSHAGYEVVTADCASAALAAAQSRHFDVIVSDIGMPVMNGYELAQALRAMPEYGAVPMIAVTGFSMYDDRERSLQCGFNAHLTKPIDLANLFDLIERLRG